MDVYEFNKFPITRTSELKSILGYNRGIKMPASEINNQWAYYMEEQIEPAGIELIEYLLF